MLKASAPSRDSVHQAYLTRNHAQSPLGPALKQAVQQGQAFGKAYADNLHRKSLPERLSRLG